MIDIVVVVVVETRSRGLQESDQDGRLMSDAVGHFLSDQRGLWDQDPFPPLCPGQLIHLSVNK